MQGTDRLRKHIEEESEKRVHQILTNANQERESILADAKREADSIRKDQAARQAKKAEVQKRQEDAMRNLAKRRAKLQVQQGLLEDTLVEVGKRLDGFDPERRRALYTHWLESLNTSTQTEIEISSKDKAWLLPVLEENYPHLKITEQEGSFSGGFIIRQGRAFQDYRFKSLLEQNRLHYFEIAAGILFEDETEQGG